MLNCGLSLPSEDNTLRSKLFWQDHCKLHVAERNRSPDNISQLQISSWKGM